MPKVVLEYSGRKFPLTLEMPWLSRPLDWTMATGRTLDVDRADAERLVETSGQDFRILAYLEDEPAPIEVPTGDGHLCPVCFKVYKYAASLKRHMKVKHADYNGK